MSQKKKTAKKPAVRPAIKRRAGGLQRAPRTRLTSSAKSPKLSKSATPSATKAHSEATQESKKPVASAGPKKASKKTGPKRAAKASSPRTAIAKTSSSAQLAKGSPTSSASPLRKKTTKKETIASQPKRAASTKSPTLSQPPKRRKASPKAQEATVDEKDELATAASAVVGDSDQTIASRAEKSLAPGPLGDDRLDSEPGYSEPYPISADDVGMLGIGSRVFPPDMGELNSTLSLEEQELETVAFAPNDASVEMQIREIQERLDGLMASPPLEDLDSTADNEGITPQALTGDSETNVVDSAREVLESEYYRKKWGSRSLSNRVAEVDEFGRDPDFEEKLRPALEFLFKRYFRVEVEGIRNVPSEGRAVVVANHSGALPFDGVMLREAIRMRHPGRDELRWLAEDFSFYLPFLGVTLNRIGAVRACPENAERLLRKEHLVGVFPEGAEGLKKLYKDRYRLQRFGRGGFVRLCLKTQSPIIPCAIIGAEETNPILHRFDNLSKLLGLDYLPITPTFPLLGPLGLLPAPTKWKIVFGEAISVEEYGPEAADDHVLVGRLAERVRAQVADLLETGLRRRKSVWI